MAYVSVILENYSNEFLLQLREDIDGIAYPGYWGFFGGGIEEGESPLGSAKRELKEELGLNLKESDFEFRFNSSSTSGKGYVFHLKLDFNIEDLNLMEGEAMKLFTINDLNKIKKRTPEITLFLESNFFW